MAGRLKPAAARAHIAAGKLGPLYVIVGDDETEKTGLVAAFGDAIDPGLRAFNMDRLYGAETTIPAFLDAVRTFPLLAPRRLVVVLQADRLFAPPRRDSAAAQKDLETLEEFVKAPEPHATVVFVADALDGRRTLTKLLYKNAIVVACGDLTDAAEAEHWVRARVDEQGMTIEAAAVRLLVERAGLDLRRLRGEVERACLFAAGRRAVTVADVREVAGGTVSQDDWAMVNALRARNAALALRELALLFDAGGVALLILGQLRSFVERSVAPPRQARAFEALLRTDLALKTMGRRDPRDEQVLLERLIVELCEGG